MKLNKVLSVFALAGAVSTIMPLVTSCNNGNEEKEEADVWYLNDKYLKSLTKDDVGVVQKIKVNNHYQLVRLIGVDQDKDTDGNILHTTWEFVNVLCDDHGYSLATFYNDVEGDSQVCDVYAETSIRNALVGEGDVSWYQKDGQTKSNEYKKSVIKMLPEDLVAKLKPTVKIISKRNDSLPGDCKYDYSGISTDKLFILSTFEMFDNNPFFQGSEDRQYSYYKYTAMSIGAKKQIANNGIVTHTDVIDAKYHGGHDCASIAGYNNNQNNYNTGYYLRDLGCYRNHDFAENYGQPFGTSSGITPYQYCAGSHGDGNVLAAPIAPAFCL